MYSLLNMKGSNNFEILNYNYRKPLLLQKIQIFSMKFDKENILGVSKSDNYTSFSKLLNKIDLSNLDEYELRTLKQEHGYLEKLRHQRIKIEEMKKKYQEVQYALQEKSQESNKLVQIIQDKNFIIEDLQQKLDEAMTNMENLQKNVRKNIEQDKIKSKNKNQLLQRQVQQIKKALKQKQMTILNLEQQFSSKVSSIKEAYQIDRKNLIIDFEEKINQVRNLNQNSSTQVSELRALVSRQNKALQLQNQRCLELQSQNESLNQQISWMQEQLGKKNREVEECQEQIQEITQQFENLQNRAQQADNNNRLKNQLQQIRRRMTEMTKGQIQKIQFIVNQIE